MRKTLLCLFILVVVLACQPEKKSNVKVASKGLPYELLVVVEDDVWNSRAGDSLRAVVKGSMAGLPQNEPLFRLIRVTPANYTRTYVTLRNILFVKTDAEKPEVGIARDAEAVPQVCISIDAPDINTLAELISQQKNFIVSQFVDLELSQEVARLKSHYNKDVNVASKEIFGKGVHVPTGLAAIKKREDFLWASTNRVDKDMNYVCYTFPLEIGKNMLSDYWVEKRDSVMKRNIPGSRPEQWMATSELDGHPLVHFRELELSGRKVYEMRGLWELHNGGIGGPFVALAYPDTVAGKVLVAEGFIYSPRTDKRELVRRMEAALRTLE